MKGKHFGRRLLAMVTLLAVLCAAVPSALATEAGYGLMDTFQDYYAQVGAEEETPDEPETPAEPEQPETKEDDPEDETKDDETPDQPADDAETDEDKQIAEAFDKMTSLFSTQADATGTAVTTGGTFYYYRGFYYDPAHTKVVPGTVAGKSPDQGGTTLESFTREHPYSVIYMDCTYKQQVNEEIKDATLYYNFGKTDAWSNTGMIRLIATCTLTLNNVEISGTPTYQGMWSMFINATVQKSKVVIQGDTKIHDIQFESGGAGVINANADGTSIIMENGEIYNISDSNYVFVARIIEINGGKIYGNTSESSTVSAYTLTMTDGLIENNKVKDATGQRGACSAGTFNMSGGTIRNTESATERDVAYPIVYTTITGGNPGRIRISSDGVDLWSHHDIAVKLSDYSLSGDSGLNEIVLLQIASPSSTSDPKVGTLSKYGTTGLLSDDTQTVYLWDGYGRGTVETAATDPQRQQRKEVAYIEDGNGTKRPFIMLLGCTGSGTDTAKVTDDTLTVGQTLSTGFTSERIESGEKIFTSPYLEWQSSDDNGKTWVSTGKNTLTTTAKDANKKYRVAMSSSASDDKSLVDLINEVASKVYTVTAPQISVTVPTTLLVNVKPDGTCEVQGSGKTNFVNGTKSDTADGETGTANGTILNNSSMDVYLTGVTFTWNTTETTENGTTTPAPSDIFTNWGDNTKPQLELAVGSNAQKSGTTTDNTSYTWKLDATTGKIDKAASGTSPGTLPLTWSFDLSGNAISQALQAGVAAPIGVITYEVSYEQPAA